MSRNLLVLITMLSGGCHAVAPPAWKVSAEAAEALAGDRAAPAVEARYGGVLHDPVAEERLERIGRQIIRSGGNLPERCRYRLLNTDHVNAVSLPGGRIYLTRGLYSRLNGDDQIAAVIAHEFAHLAARDHFKPRCDGAREAVTREALADLRALTYLRRAGVDGSALVRVLRLIEHAQPRGWSDIRIAVLAREGLITTPAWPPLLSD